ncbi:hypothetical protein WISP_78139 [Willisornis vidua]|uniref:Uncharacterized protein n=1 Tax=Willisornis vidua TaxID=1566151 RepID=A0ABQ9D5I4_9PASS|nr:hypothetical protein WISP_78139 [Willisornis vidua]
MLPNLTSSTNLLLMDSIPSSKSSGEGGNSLFLSVDLSTHCLHETLAFNICPIPHVNDGTTRDLHRKFLDYTVEDITLDTRELNATDSTQN